MNEIWTYFIGVAIGLLIGFAFARGALAGQERYYEDKLDALQKDGE